MHTLRLRCAALWCAALRCVAVRYVTLHYLLLEIGLNPDLKLAHTSSFEKHQDCRTRGNNLKLVSHRCHYDLRKYFVHE